jgi:phosphate acetyltransferase
MNFHEKVCERAKGLKARIVLPESFDVRIQKAALKALKNELVKDIVFIGDPDEIARVANSEGIDLKGIEIVNPLKSDFFDDFAHTYHELRKHKGLSFDEAVEQMRDPVYFAAMIVRKDHAHGLVAGATHSTAHIIRAALKVIGVKEGNKTASSSMVMIVPDKSFGYDGQLIFADCGTVPLPDASQLADIAIASAETGVNLIGFEPVVAMLSFSTKGSAPCEIVDKVIEATALVKQRRPDLVVDGEMQADAALVNCVANKKCPGSPAGGKSNVLIFPDLNAGNISYKLVQRLARAEAYGPILQGFKKPVNDLSRGCSLEDIVNVIAITAVQALS